MGLHSSYVDLGVFGKRRFPKALAQEYPFKMRGIVMDDDEDGDNVRVVLDRALGDRTEASIRILGHSAAESSSKDPFERWLGEKAKLARKIVLSPNSPVGIRSEKLDTDYGRSFVRILGYVDIEDAARGVRDVSEVLVSALTPGIWPASVWKKEGIPPWAKDQWWEQYEREVLSGNTSEK